MILVGQYDSPVTRRIGISLHHYGIPFSRDTRSIFGDAAEIAKISPLTRIPALILDDGEVLIDSVAILDHLDEVAGPARALAPPNGPQRRRVLQDSALAQGTLEKVAAVVYERHYHPAAHVSQDWQARCQSQLAAGLTELENRSTAPWFCGDDFSHADVMVTCLVAYLDLRLPEAFPPSAFPKLQALATKCEALPAFKAAAIAANETMPKDQ
jgi:glutathione S-transferase